MSEDKKRVRAFVAFLLTKSFQPRRIRCDGTLIDRALDAAIEDSRYHASRNGGATQAPETIRRILRNLNETPVFLYRLARQVYERQPENGVLLDAINWAMKEACSCEIYYSNEIDVGFYVVHGLGTVIGSRNRIGKGFTIYQGCTIGHMSHAQAGAAFGDHVTMYANSYVYGNVRIGDDVVIGSNCMVIKDVAPKTRCLGFTINSLKQAAGSPAGS